jgi:hypothetical protein
MVLAKLPATTMRRISRLFMFGSLLVFLVMLVTACNSKPSEPKPQVSDNEPREPAPSVQPITPEPTPEPTPLPEPAPPPDPALDERKQALANVGRSAFEALQADDFEALLQLTPLVDGYLRDVCSERPVSPREQLEARFTHCRNSIPWADVAEAQAFAAQPTGTPASGCDGAVEDYGRLQLFLHMNDKSIWRVEFYGAIGQDGSPIGIGGEVSCRKVDEAPKLK